MNYANVMSPYKLASWHYSIISHNKQMWIIIGFINFLPRRLLIFFIHSGFEDTFHLIPKPPLCEKSKGIYSTWLPESEHFDQSCIFNKPILMEFFWQIESPIILNSIIFQFIVIFYIFHKKPFLLLVDIVFQFRRLISIFG